jgi:large conductance mechanosensitive channel
MGIISEFKAFLDEYKVMGLAVAFIIGAALTTLVTSLVNDIIMPVINPVLAATGTEWRNASLNVGSQISIKYGSFLGQLINFVIIAFIVFLIAKYIMGEKKVAKK